MGKTDRGLLGLALTVVGMSGAIVGALTYLPVVTVIGSVVCGAGLLFVMTVLL